MMELVVELAMVSVIFELSVSGKLHRVLTAVWALNNKRTKRAGCRVPL